MSGACRRLGYRGRVVSRTRGIHGVRAPDRRRAGRQDLRHATGAGPAALLLHGGPGIGAEYLVGLVEELDGLINGVLPQQRGLEPSTLEGPRDVETHVADMIAVLDGLGLGPGVAHRPCLGRPPRDAHRASAHPERVTGLILFETLGAIPDGGSAELVVNMVARLTPDERAKLDALVARQEAGDDDPTLMGQLYMTLWPSYSFIHGNVLPFTSLRLEIPLDGEPIDDRLGDRPFRGGDPGAGPARPGPAGAADPRRRRPDAADRDDRHRRADPGARVEIVQQAGHYPWLERAGEVRRIVAAFLDEHPAPFVPDRLLDPDFVPEP